MPVVRPAWQRAVKDDDMAGKRRGRQRMEAPTSMQAEAATWRLERWLVVTTEYRRLRESRRAEGRNQMA